MRGRHGWVGFGLGLLLVGACGESSPGSVGAVAGEGGEAASASATGGKRSGVVEAPGRGGSRPVLGEGGRGAEFAGGAAAGEASVGPPAVVEGVDCNGERFELDGEIVRRCVVAMSCLGRDGGIVSSCIEYWPKFAGYHLGRFGGQNGEVLDRPLQFATHLEPCVDAPLDSCDDVLACSGLRAVVDECDGDLATRCEGELAIDCGTLEVRDCQRLTGESGRCREGEGGPHCLVVPACVEGEEGESSACEGDLAYSCSDGVGYGLDCSQRGMTCGMLAGLALCRDRELPSESCTNLGETACVGDAMTFCNDDGVLFEHDCGALGMTCTTEGSAVENPVPEWLDCVMAGCTPDYTATDHCEGDELILPLSMQGEAGVRLHCPDYGFATCKDDRCAN